MTETETNQPENVSEHEKSETGKQDDRTDQNRIPRARLNQEIEKRKATEKELQAIADDLKQDVSEDMQELIPDLPPGKLIKWLRSASAKGLFEKKPVESIDTKKPGDKKPLDHENMNPVQLMAQGYKT